MPDGNRLEACVTASALTSRERVMLKLSEQVSKLQTEIDELKPKAEASAKLETDLAASNQKNSELEAEKKDLSTKLEIANGDVTTLQGEKTELAGKITKLESEKQTVDQAADIKAREIAARAGGNLPAKEPGAGDQTTDDAKIATGTPRTRLAAIFEPKGA